MAAAAALLLLSTTAQANMVCFRGINISGAEFGKRDGVYGTDYTWPGAETIAYFAARGFNSIRLPFLWERLQPALEGPLDSDELKRLTDTVALIRSHRMSVILDPHNYARYDGRIIGSKDVSREAFADFWKRLAPLFAGQNDVILGLMNEPHGILAADWLETANGAIAAIREAGANNLVLVPGTSWTGAHSWNSTEYGGSNASTMTGTVDPANNFAIEFHQYFDTDFSGKNGTCDRAADAVEAVRNVTGWLRDTGNRGYLGEFGVPQESACVAALGEMVAVVENNPDLWTGWAYWVAGDWWPEDEELNIQPTSAGDRPQLEGLLPALRSGPANRNACSG